MDREREDRRVRRTRRLLQEALLALTLERGYDRVTVQDVLDRADVGRATFYAHFRDKDDLLVSGAEEVRESLRRHLTAAARADADRSGEELALVHRLFDHAAAHRRLYRAFLGKRAGAVVLKNAHEQLAALLREHLEEVVTSRRVTPAVPVEVTVQYLASALLGVLTWWLDNDTPYSAERMGRMFLRLTQPAVAAALSPTR